MSVQFNQLMTGNEADALAVAELSEFIEDRLFLMVLSNHRDSTTLQTFSDWKMSLNDDSVFYLNVDDSLVYEGFHSDFGPLNLAMIYRYIDIIRDKFKVYKRIVHCSHKSDQRKQANAAFLISAYMIIEKNYTAHQVYSILSQQHKYKYVPFRDASCLLDSEYSVTIEECVNALYKAKWYRFFDFNDFDLNEYEKYETVEYGDINWIVPDTMLAFSSPRSRDHIDKSGYMVHSPAYYYNYFKANNIKHVVRLNSKNTYDARRTFVEAANIQHTDLIFTDGTPPTDAILNKFLDLCEQYIEDIPEVKYMNNEITGPNAIDNTKRVNDETSSAFNCVGAVAVHCKAGLGRTGCLVASYIVKHWSFTAVEAIAWIRICRPGSVIGVQQKWLIDKEEHLKTVGKQWREKRKHAVDKYKRFTNGVYSVKRHSSSVNVYEYVDPPLDSCISKEQNSPGNSDSVKTERVKSEMCRQSRFSSILKKKLKSNNHGSPDAQNVPNVRQKRSASKTEDPKLNSTLSTVKSSRRVTNASNALTVSNAMKKKITVSNTITVAKSNFKGTAASKKNVKALSKTESTTRSTTKKAKETEAATKTSASESTPSYALSTVSSSARMSRRLFDRNCN